MTSSKSNPSKRKAAESGSGDPQPTQGQPKVRKTMGSDPFRHVTFDSPYAAPSSNLGGPQHVAAQSKKRKKGVLDPFRHVAIDGPSNEPESNSGDPQPVAASSKRRKTTKSGEFKQVEFDSAGKIAKSKQGTPQRVARKSRGREEIFFPMEIWDNIMLHSDYRTIQALAATEQRFKDWIEPESFWKTRRKTFYNTKEHAPPPAPPGMSESRFAHLLEGRGCMGCKKDKPTKTFWPFSARWCKKCFQQLTMKAMDIHKYTALVIQEYKLDSYMSPAIIDWKGNYQGAGNEVSRAPNPHRPPHLIFSRSQVDAVLRRCIGDKDAVSWAFLNDENEHGAKLKDEIRTRYAADAKQEEARNEACLVLERWEKSERKRRRGRRASLQGARRAFFADRAMTELGIEEETLVKRKAFRKAVLVAKEPSKKAWAHLKNKLIEKG